MPRLALRPTAAWVLPPLALALLVPFLIDQYVWKEWANYLWLVQRQQASIEAAGHPSLFLHESFGLFYPQYAFYGGSLWAAAGALGALIGSSWTAFVAFLVGACAMAYGGTFWLGRQLGLGRVLAHLPAFAVLTAPYTLGVDLYGRGDWAEIIATSAVPLALAGALAVARAPRVPRLALGAVIGAVAIVAASHGITLLWGSIFALGLVGVLLLARPAGEAVPWRRLGLLVVAAALGVALNLWFLLPQLAYAKHTDIYRQFENPGLTPFNAFGVIFSPLPRFPSDATGNRMYLQLPVLVLAWGLAAGVAARRASRALWRTWCGLVALTVVFVALVHTDVIFRGPYFLRSLQFSFRLQTYVVLAVAGLAIVGLLATARSGRRAVWIGALGAALAWQLGVGFWTATQHDHGDHFRVSDVRPDTVVSPFSGYQTQQFKLRSGGTPLPKPTGAPLDLPPAKALEGPVRFQLPSRRAGVRYATNVTWSPLVKATGAARIVGRDPEGFAVLEATPSPDRIVAVKGARPWPVTVGLATTALAGLASVALLVFVAPRTRRRRRRARGR